MSIQQFYLQCCFYDSSRRNIRTSLIPEMLGRCKKCLIYFSVFNFAINRSLFNNVAVVLKVK